MGHHGNPKIFCEICLLRKFVFCRLAITRYTTFELNLTNTNNQTVSLEGEGHIKHVQRALVRFITVIQCFELYLSYTSLTSTIISKIRFAHFFKGGT